MTVGESDVILMTEFCRGGYEELVHSSLARAESHAKEPPCPSMPWFGSSRNGCQRGKKGEGGAGARGGPCKGAPVPKYAMVWLVEGQVLKRKKKGEKR